MTPNSLYRVSATWQTIAGAATASPFSTYSGSVAPANLLGAVLVDQSVAPNDFTADSGVWEDLGGAYRVSASGTLIVQLSTAASGTMLADAVRLDPISAAEIQVVDNTTSSNVVDGNTTISLGSVLVGSSVSRTFTIFNRGTSALSVGTPVLPYGYNLTSAPASSVSSGSSTTFSIALRTDLPAGNYSGNVVFANGDSDESPFEFALLGQVTSDTTGPSFTSSDSTSVLELRTNVLTVAATDEHGPVTFSISSGVDGGVDRDRFEINSTTGELTFKSAPDFETPTDDGTNNIYNVIVTATDDFGNTSTQAITVTVINVVETPPTGDTQVSLSGSILSITEINRSNNDRLTIQLVDGMIRVINANFTVFGGAGTLAVDARTMDVPFEKVTQIVVSTNRGSDSLTVDFANGNPIPTGGMSYDGGVGPIDTLIIKDAGMEFDTTIIKPLTRIGGTVDFISGATHSLLNYNHLGVLKLNGTESSNLTFSLLDSNNRASVADIGGADGKMRFAATNFLGADFTVAGITTLSVLGNGGNDSLTMATRDAAFAGRVILDGGNGNDTLKTAGLTIATSLIGGEGNDALTSGSGNDTLDGGIGNDSLRGQNGNDTLNGDIGNDSLMGGEGDDVVNGGDDNDTIDSGAGNDIADGGNGNDKVTGNKGRDLLIGGTGSDQVIGSEDDDIVIAGQVTAANSTALSALLSSVRTAWSGAGTYEERRDTVTSKLITTTNVVDDSAADTLTGSSNRDLFFASLTGVNKDKLTDRINGGANNEDLLNL